MGFKLERENTGMIFANEGGKDNSPQFTGLIDIGGQQFRIALWEKEYKSGWGFSAKISEDEEVDEAPAARRPESRAPERPASRERSSGSGSVRPKPTRR